MTQFCTAVKNNLFLYKLTGVFAPFKHVFKNRRIYLPAFTVKVNRTLIAIVISYVKPHERGVLWVEKIWVRPEIFSVNEPIRHNNRHPYFDSIIETFNLYLQSFKPTFSGYNINTLCYRICKTSEEDQALVNSILWYGFHEDMERTLYEFEPTTSWREKEEIPFKIYTKRIL